MKGPYKEFAQEFLPHKIRYLLIGESPPYTPPNEELRYFYNYRNSSGRQILLSTVSYSFLNKKFYNKRDDKQAYLKELKEKEVFLFDTTYEPINKKDKKSRQSKISDEYPHLKKNIDDLPIKKRVKIFLIHKNVIEAIGETLRRDFSNCEYKLYDIGFPRYYNDEEFKSKIIRGIEN